MNTDMDIFAELFATLIVKYIDKIDLDSLPDPLPPDLPQKLTE